MRPSLALALTALAACATTGPAAPAIGQHAMRGTPRGAAWPDPVPPKQAGAPLVGYGDSLGRVVGAPRGRVVVTAVCDIVILEPIDFWPNTAQLAASAQPMLEAIAASFQRIHSDGQRLEVAIVGHAEAGERDPRALAFARARTIAAALTGRGVTPGMPFVLDATVDARGERRGRRVDFLILERQSD